MNTIDTILIKKALEKFRNAALNAERNAAYGGRTDDGGASLMRAQASAYEDGLNMNIPNFLMSFVKEINREEDPEYEKYLELKRRFE